jgi:nucleotide-binding universal stress UspA family protein
MEAMTYSTLMVQLELEHPNDARLRIAGDLAEQFGAKLVGIAACEQSTPPYYADGPFAQGLLERDRAELRKRMAETEERFRAAAKGRAQVVEWRSALAHPTSYVAQQARIADLIITGTNRDGWALDPARRLDPSALVMEVGRPVFLVPPEVEWLKLSTVLVAWKDTREARRAVWDALPLLLRAQEVTIAEVVEGEESPDAARNRVNDVAGWLARHGVVADVMVPEATENTDERLDLIASDIGADLVVAGAYGHTRLGEWMFGGVTRDLVSRSTRCSVLAH